jgi:chromate transporter
MRISTSAVALNANSGLPFAIAIASPASAALGVILNLALWFAIHVMFSRVSELRAGPVRMPLADAASLDIRMLALSLASGFMLLRLHWSLHRTLAVTAALGVLVALVWR